MFSVIADMIKFYEGAISLHEAETMPFQKIFILQREAVKINKEIKRQLDT